MPEFLQSVPLIHVRIFQLMPFIKQGGTLGPVISLLGGEEGVVVRISNINY